MKTIFKFFYQKFLNLFLPKVKDTNFNIKHYGTYYGGYDIVDDVEIKNVVSCGLGEDASFDIEIINKKNSVVYAVDPTPKSIVYYQKIRENFGSTKTESYSSDGNQSIRSYDLKNVSENNFILVNYAIYNSSKREVKLYYPANKNFVSTSINKNKNYSEDFFYAKIITLDQLIEKFLLKDIDLLKLDIEGAEIEVIKDFLNKKIFPKQIAVEFTNIRSFNFFDRLKIFLINRRLEKNNYILVFENKKGDFTYLFKKR
jgi:FkbM family methyltransferase